MALPYTAQWVGVASASPPASEQWHLYWEGNDSVLCGIPLDGGENDIGALMTGKEMRAACLKTDSFAAWNYQCDVCATQFRKVLYWKIEHGEYLEDMRT